MFLRRPKINRRTLPFLALLCSALVITLVYELELYRGFHPQENVPQSPFAPTLPLSGADLDRKPKGADQPVLTNPQNAQDGTNAALANPHPIDELVKAAADEFNLMQSRQTHGVHAAADAYRRRRGRHPPPRFDQWVQFAEANNAVIIEDFFDRIHHDLDPFWGLPPDQIRNSIASWQHMISIRDGEVTQRTDGDRHWMNVWHEMFAEISPLLPDVDIPINEMDESRVLVPWASINHHKTVADMRKEMLVPTADAPMMQNYSRLSAPVHSPERFRHEFFTDAPIWSLIKESCPPDSPARDSPFRQDFAIPPVFNFTANPNHTFYGYISNWTYSTDPCQLPHLAGLHGAFVEPISMSSTRKLVPMFGGSKFSMNNDILLPAARYWMDDDAAIDDINQRSWEQKRDGIMWRGAASGGRHRATTWRHFQRQRLMSMVNSSQITAEQDRAKLAIQALGENVDAPESPDAPHNFPLPDTQLYRVSAVQEENLADWVGEFSDAGFTFMNCFPIEEAHETAGCSYTDQFYQIMPFVPLQEQTESKYLPDVDGSAFSDRFRSFLRSTSLPIKATVYAEWHDNRLIPWKHFVPMDNTFYDFYGIMEYFLGYNGGRNGASFKGHDAVARDIATSGHEWAMKVLRKEDMIVYMYRLVLEFARICEEDRSQMGFVDDIHPDPDGSNAADPISPEPLSLNDAGRFSDTTKYQQNKASGANWGEESQEESKPSDDEKAPLPEILNPDDNSPDRSKPVFQNDRIEEAAEALGKHIAGNKDTDTSPAEVREYEAVGESNSNMMESPRGREVTDEHEDTSSSSSDVSDITGEENGHQEEKMGKRRRFIQETEPPYK